MRDKNGIHKWMSLADKYETYLIEVEHWSIYGGCRNSSGELVDDNEG